jgi:membrane protease subunit HflC
MVMKNKALPLALLLFVGLLSVFTVREGQNALILRLGKIVELNGAPDNYLPGLHFKFPIIDSILRYDKRLQTLTPQYTQKVLTAEQKRLIVDYYVKWKIYDLAKFYKSTGGDVLKAEDLLVQKVSDSLRAAFGQRTISEVVSAERREVLELLKQQSDAGATPLGIKVIDVRIKKIDLPKEVQVSVYNRMSTDRERVATKHRAQGKSEAEKIRAAADANVTLIIAEANNKAANIRAKGVEDAARIYNESYAAAPQFYKFYASLAAYKNSFNEHDMVVMGKGSGFMNNFFNPDLK